LDSGTIVGQGIRHLRGHHRYASNARSGKGAPSNFE
jgi:hypothetical protein